MPGRRNVQTRLGGTNDGNIELISDNNYTRMCTDELLELGKWSGKTAK